MKTETIKQSIINNYQILAKKSKVKSNQSDIITIWGLNYKHNDKPLGFVNELGLIQRKKAKIEVKNNELKTVKKPLFSTWKQTLKNIDNMLKDITSNYDNPEVITKKYVKLLCFSKDAAERILKIGQNL